MEFALARNILSLLINCTWNILPSSLKFTNHRVHTCLLAIIASATFLRYTKLISTTVIYLYYYYSSKSS